MAKKERATKVIIPVVTTSNIEKFVGTNIVDASNRAINVVFSKYPGTNSTYATQRPSTNTLEVASTKGVGAKGRGIYHWEKNTTTYICNDGEIYPANYTASTMSITAGEDKVHFSALGDYLVCIDPQNNQGWVIDTANNIQEMTGNGNWGASSGNPAYDFAGFSVDADTSANLVDGIEVLDETMYVFNTEGRIRGSGLADPLNWDALNVITAEKEPDAGVMLSQHHNTIVAIGRRTTEFFYNAGNPTGSPLSARNDITYNIGCADGKSFFQESDVLYFIGSTNSGEIGAYKLEQFQLLPIADPATVSFFTSTVVTNNADILGSGFSSGGRTFYLITIYSKVAGVITPDLTAVYNTQTKTWTEWDSANDNISHFPVVGWTLTTDSLNNNAGRGIFSNGDYFTILDNFVPQDTGGASLYVASGYVATGYVLDTTATVDNIPITIRIGHLDFGTRGSKRMHECRYIGDETDNAQNLLIRWSDEGQHDDMNVGRNIAVGTADRKITRLGPFRSRTFQLEYTASDQIRIQGLEVVVQEDSN